MLGSYYALLDAWEESRELIMKDWGWLRSHRSDNFVHRRCLFFNNSKRLPASLVNNVMNDSRVCAMKDKESEFGDKNT